VADENYLDESRCYLPPGTRIYVSHLPRQKWRPPCARVRPCAARVSSPFLTCPFDCWNRRRLSRNCSRLCVVLQGPRRFCSYPATTRSRGALHAVSEALSTGLLERYGFRACPLRGIPRAIRESHSMHREAERRKVTRGRAWLRGTFHHQFLFESGPYFQWVNDHRETPLAARYVCGLAGPAKITTLMRYALRCGSGPRCEGLAHTIPHSRIFSVIMGRWHATSLARKRATGACVLDGVHMFCFGGFLRNGPMVIPHLDTKVTLNGLQGTMRDGSDATP